MWQRLVCFFMSSFPLLAAGQFAVTIEVTLPETVKAEALYLAGNFNGWNPQDEENAKLVKQTTGKFVLTVNNVPAGTYEYKLTRGSWETVECKADGSDAANRILELSSDTLIQLTIPYWKDQMSTPKTRPHTFSTNVIIDDTSFAFPQLNRTRRIWVYLPATYKTSTKKFPVLYMHDGQNLFDDATSYAGEWGVDEFLDSIKNQCIVVGIDNGGTKRMNEYNPFDDTRFGKGEGKAYLEWLVKNVKPYIDSKYRTKSDKKNTMIAGSSMGGLISFYAGLYYPDVFGGLGVFSPSFWINPAIEKEINSVAKSNTHGYQKYYFYAGGKEQGMVPDMQRVAASIKKAAGVTSTERVNEQGLHNEPTWRKEFPAFYNWMTGL